MNFSTRLLEWYSRNKRRLPWRNQTDPYRIWISEIMLQQTRVETVIPYYKDWIKRFPSVGVLASSNEQEVLSAWEGLGYYSRARNLLKAARIIVNEYGSNFPSDVLELSKLPGIGRYTAGAVASIAFGQDTSALDGNMKRILARLFNVSEQVDSSSGEKILWELVEKYMPKGHAGDFHQALMDLGATICFSRDPNCNLCPLGDTCISRSLGIQGIRPVFRPRNRIPHYIVTAGVLQRGGKVLISRRPTEGLLGGLWKFPGGKVDKDETIEDCLAREIYEELKIHIRVGNKIGIYKHAYTHFRITLHAFKCELKSRKPIAADEKKIVWVPPENLKNYPMGKVDRRISQNIIGA